jgi:peptidoglycan/LPS O-acetylase OafA/YrhL
MQYRYEIDGLRAISVLAVILFHANVFGMGGGFVGVDIFFVISGYLITLINLKSFESGTFSLIGFYEKRIRRLFPALLSVLILSVLMSYFFLLPYELKRFFQSLISSVAFASNIFFYLKSGYFDVANEIKPLIHTWSLSLEEQFYFVFPLLLILMGQLKKNLRLITILALFSFVACLLTSNPTAKFYLLHTRAWELLAGSGLACYHAKTHNSERRFDSPFTSASGLVLIFASFVLIDSKSNHPGFVTLFPVLGALLFIYPIKSNRVAAALSHPILVFIGSISYSLYLVHQPVFVFTRLISGKELNTLSSTLAVAISFFLATMLWHFVETPFRKKTFLQNRIAFTGLFFGFVLVALGSGVGIKNGGFPSRVFSHRPKNFLKSFAQDDTMKIISDKCKSQKDLCLISDHLHPIRKVLLVGDSHAIDFVTPFYEMSGKERLKAYYSAVGGCSFLLEKKFPECEKSLSRLLTAVANKTIDDIIFVENFEAHTQNSIENGITNLKKLIDYVEGSGIKLHIFIPRISFNDSISHWGLSPFVSLSEKHDFMKTSDKWVSFYENQRAGTLYDQKAKLCSLSVVKCSPIEKGSLLPLYRDSDHLTPYAAKIIFEDFSSRLLR